MNVHDKGGRNTLLVVVISSSSSRESFVHRRNRNWAGRIRRVKYRWGRTSRVVDFQDMVLGSNGYFLVVYHRESKPPPPFCRKNTSVCQT